ncbi:hypothetical protein GCM10010191_19200 [Actinomadura vinacea]|uniref:SDR family NAD(P)-dependent oxidoreductase n=1 Tax=Actinomadura vinacea TaxID=115336 RepID=A0ABN3IRH9_9ACTN
MSGTDIAVVGVACRFPGAPDLAAYWRLIASGREGVSRLSAEELRSAGASEERVADPRLVGAGGIVEDGEDFDAAFFGYPAREAALMDPQQRMFLEAAWHALEDSGHAPALFPGRIGIYGGQTVSTHRPVGLDDFLGDVGASLLSANDKDFLTTRVSYKLGLTGPSMNVQATCATSLVAVHLAAQALLTYECDMSLAGGVSWSRSRRLGYLHQPGSTLSADGHVRPFDRDASGFVPADGVGIVVLRRLADALEDGDRIYAVVKGSAVNNDGGDKPSYAAPSAAGQERVIRDALAVAGVDPGTLGYVEAHGTATAIGDVVEFSALSRVYGGRCPLGSVKANIGHADSAAGVAGFIKAAMMLHHGFRPPCPNFGVPNPDLSFREGALRPPLTEGEPWPSGAQPRRAAVSAFGVGGTNAHVILQEAPPPTPSDIARPWQLLALSARNADALDAVAGSCAAFLEEDTGVNLADVAWTTAGLHRFERRFAGVFHDGADAVRALRAFTAAGGEKGHDPDATVFMFPGGDAREAGMGRDLYEWSAVFRDSVEECLRHAASPEVRDALLLPHAEDEAADPRHGLPALFIAEVALGRLLISLGIRPDAVLGHDLGEYTAAHFARVLSLPDAMKVVTGFAHVRHGGAAATLRRLLSGIPLAEPAMVLVSDGEPTDPQYWVRHAEPVARTAESLTWKLDRVLGTGHPALIETGPGTALTTLAQEHGLATRAAALVSAADRPTIGRDGRTMLLEAVGPLWAAGLDVDLPALHADERRVRVPFAKYPFARTPMPSAGADRRSSGRPADWLYGVGWRRSMDIAVHDPEAVVAGRRWAVLSDGSPLARQIIEVLRSRGAEPVVATPGEEFRRLSPTSCTFAPARPEQYARFLDLTGDAENVRIVDLWSSLEPEEEASALDSVIGLARAAHPRTGRLEVWVVTRGAYRITGGESPAPCSAGAHAAAQTLVLETPHVTVRCVDLDPGAATAAELLTEFARPDAEDIVGYRAGRRWVREFRPLAADRLPAAPLRDAGTYLITGGLGGVGLAIARHLARSHRARLVLLGRGAGRPEDPAVLEEMHRAGGEVLVRGVDVADGAALKDVLRETRQRFGAVDGVVHAAGVIGAGSLRSLDREEVAASFRAKAAGTRALIDALSALGETPDFLALFSSLAALSGAPGQGCYAAANACLDSFAGRAPFPVLSINWDRWRGLGMTGADRTGRTSITPGMESDDALKAFELALSALPLEHVAVATAPPGGLFQLMSGRRRVPDEDGPPAPSAMTARPDLPTSYQAPRTELETRVTAVWETVLGIEGIGVHDDFFDLGGHSIIALDIVQHCEESFGTEVPVQTLFTDPTVAAFTRALAEEGASERGGRWS